MRILVVGAGAREDALSWALARPPGDHRLFAAPGNAGTARRGENWPIAATDGKALVSRALEERIDLALLGPETAVAAGVADRLREARIPTFGPNRSAGRLESSKIFAKRFMTRYGIPTADARIVHSHAGARKALADWNGACVVKADGLAAGKGVVVAADASQARAVIDEWYGGSGIPGGGSDVLLEERLEGREVSVFAVGDGKRFLPLAAACDYKRRGDGDTGPNTGGMGAYSPPFEFPENLLATVDERILSRVAQGLAAEGERYVGVLYCGLMWTPDGPAVIEFNVRFGDPETQALMPRMRGDFARLLLSAAQGDVAPPAAQFCDDACVAVVLATADYPSANTPVHGLPAELGLEQSCTAFWGASTLRDGNVDAAGGRVLTMTACGETVTAARERVYSAVEAVRRRCEVFQELSFRRDVAMNVGDRTLGKIGTGLG